MRNCCWSRHCLMLVWFQLILAMGWYIGPSSSQRLFSEPVFAFHHNHTLDSITVDYGGQHPFERQRRWLQNLRDDEPIANTNLNQRVDYGESRTVSEPIRIRFVTAPLDAKRMPGTNDAVLVDFINQQVRVEAEERKRMFVGCCRQDFDLSFFSLVCRFSRK